MTGDDRPTDPHGLRHRMPADALIARYPASAARTHVIRCVMLAAFSAFIVVLVIVLAVNGSMHWFPTVLICVIVGWLAGYALLGASAAKSTWSSDDGLAIAVSSEGIVLPLTGLIQWGEIAGITVNDYRLFSTSKAIQDWAFGSTDQMITVYAADVDRVLARADELAKFSLTVNGDGVKNGFVGGFGRQMMYGDSFAEVVAAITAHAAQHGIPVGRNKVP